MKKNILILSFIFINCIFIYSESLVLKDGKVIKGDLVLLNKDNASLKVSNNMLEVKIRNINLLINDSYKDDKLLDIVDNRKGIIKKAFFIKLTDYAVYYYSSEDDFLKISYLNGVSKLNYRASSLNKDYSTDEYNLSFNDVVVLDFNEIIDNLKRKSINIYMNNYDKELSNNLSKNNYFNLINIEDDDFYEKYWAGISKYINDSTKNLIWNLFELYSEKEKQFNIIFNEEILNKSNHDIHLSREGIDKKLKELKDRVLDLRRDFFLRGKKIVYNSEFL